MRVIVDTRWNLHRARVSRSIGLDRITAVTALSPSIVRKIDEGRFEELPGGLYARSYVRTFAEMVGIPPEQALKDVESLLPGAPDPIPAMHEHLDGPLQKWMAALRQRGQDLFSSRMAGQAEPVSVEQSSWSLSRIEAAPMAASVRRLLAASVDAVILATVGATTAGFTAWLCGVSFVLLLEQAGAELAIMLIPLVALYFVIFQGIGGRTPGARLCGLPRSSDHRELRIGIIASRIFRTN